MALRRSPRLAAKANPSVPPQGPRRSARLAVPDNIPIVSPALSRHSTPKEIILHYSNEWEFPYTDDLLTQFELAVNQPSPDWWVEVFADSLQQQVRHWLMWECPITSEQIMDDRVAKCLQNRCARNRISYSQNIFNKFIKWASDPTSEFPGQIYDCFIKQSLVPKYKYIRLLSIPQCVDSFFAAY